MSDGFLVALGALIPTVIGAVVLVLNTFHKNKQELRASQFSDQTAIIEQLRREINRHEAYIASQQRAIEELRDQHVECREESAELRGYLVLLHDYARRTHAVLTAAPPLGAGMNYEPPPDMPISSIRRREPSEFEQRTAAQHKVDLQSLAPPKPPAGGAGS